MARPKKEPLPLDLDPAKPLENKQHETFCQLVASDKPKFEAYQIARGGRVSYDNAKVGASVWQRRPEVKERLNWLIIDAQKATKTAPTLTGETLIVNRPKPPRPTPPATPTTEAMGRAELYALITAEIRAGRVDPALVSSLLKVAPELGEVDQSRPDPTAVISYVCHFAGRPGDEIARELGGLEFIAAKLCDVLKVSPADLASVLLTKGHGKGHEVQNPQAGIESPLNTQSNGAADHAPIAGEAQDATT